MSKNIQRLGATLTSQMKRTSDAAVPTTIDLGVVNENLSITPDILRNPIPKGEYMVNLMLTGGKVTAAAGSDGGHTHNLPGSLRGLRPGDRVLIVWAGKEPIVVAIVVSSAIL